MTEEINYRGCKIFRGPDHRGRSQWWISIPRERGTLRYGCNGIDDGKAAIDAHLSGDTKSSTDYTVPVSIILLLIAFIAAFAGFGGS